VVTPATRREAVAILVARHKMSERQACAIIGADRTLIRYRHDEWGVDVTVGGSQKGLMLPPGLSFHVVSEKARAAAKDATSPRSFWGWEEMIAANKTGYFPYTPATNMLQSLKVARRSSGALEGPVRGSTTRFGGARPGPICRAGVCAQKRNQYPQIRNATRWQRG
jgi:hypothetical protein